MLDLIINKADLAMIRRTASPTPIGQTPGFLSSAMSLQATNREIIKGSTKHVHSLQAKIAMEQHSSPETDPKAEQRHLHS